MKDLLTETIAKTKQCRAVSPWEPPHAMSSASKAAGPLTFHTCVASQCMQWRFSQQDSGGDPTGFCGLAGLPKYI